MGFCFKELYINYNFSQEIYMHVNIYGTCRMNWYNFHEGSTVHIAFHLLVRSIPIHTLKNDRKIFSYRQVIYHKVCK